ncbi:MarR family transcriptional regulator [Halobiforma lacisalsi AJ5]|uniref:MarR family transcriptional regulator n=1 Tax=Natronobacterium lacisalsi AJ5 TaxID=358396 RepID=M0LGU9_NATLA|nr:hypothetical protein [Halobiforma lacisalsi]APW99521.1 MarR family transcriptional regulator [Halobiforma lacisalsi AJ5]EMA31644.1 hypothetical protein C445_14217 [Halobiforma lacisalsi AJ5]
MLSQEHRSEKRIEPVPEGVESAQAKLVYIYLEAVGGATVDELADGLTLKKIDVLSVLNSLSTAGVIERDGDEYVAS